MKFVPTVSVIYSYSTIIAPTFHDPSLLTTIVILHAHIIKNIPNFEGVQE